MLSIGLLIKTCLEVFCHRLMEKHLLGRLLALLGEIDGDAMALGVGHQFLPRQQVPLAPRRDDADVGAHRVGAEFEAHLVVALAGRTVADGVGAGGVGDLDQPLGDQRPGDRRAGSKS